MTIWENIISSWQSLRSNKTRSGLTILGIVIGVSAVVFLVSFGKGHQQNITNIFESMGANVLALAPGKCVMLEGNPVTRRRLEASGCEVLTYEGSEVSLKAEGGPTCLTRPILRFL